MGKNQHCRVSWSRRLTAVHETITITHAYRSKGEPITKPKWVAAHLENLPRVGSRVTDELAVHLTANGVDVLHLHAHPRRQLPEHVADAADRAARDNRVAPSRGLLELREAIAAS